MTRLWLPALALAALSTPAFAHSGHEGVSPFIGGLLHPLSGLDHMLAMVAVGIWAAMLGERSVRAVPAAFVTIMLAGFALATTGIPLPFVEPGIAVSVLVLGLLIAAAVRLPLGASATLVGMFALFHGHAHGTELAGSALGFGAGFGVSTILLHGVGIGIGLLLATPKRLILARGVGVVTAGAGVLLLGGWS